MYICNFILKEDDIDLVQLSVANFKYVSIRLHYDPLVTLQTRGVSEGEIRYSFSVSY